MQEDRDELHQAVLTRKDLELKLVAKAWQDDAFRQQLLNNPRATIQQELGIELPEDVEVKIFEEQSDQAYVLLLQKPTRVDQATIRESEELSDESLDAVAGGGVFVVGSGTYALVAQNSNKKTFFYFVYQH
ncbi:MAG: NHLP leader peptide family RiPP precursor [Cyanophyceae cyanobacterium]